MVSVIIPFFNESNSIANCLESLANQSLKDIEILAVDDGSSDNSIAIVKNLQKKFSRLILLTQKHLGPARARNLAAGQARGEILVFVDADMTFDQQFVFKLTKPLMEGKSKGTFTKDEYVSNWDNIWSRCWNYNDGLKDKRKISLDYPSLSPVFRSILRTEFIKANGFDDIGFTDDWTLSRKLGFEATVADGAICYHQNPSRLSEVYIQSRWIGKNEFISGTFLRKVINLIRFNPVYKLPRSILIAIKYGEPGFIIFSVVYYWGIWLSIIKSFLNETKSK